MVKVLCLFEYSEEFLGEIGETIVGIAAAAVVILQIYSGEDFLLNSGVFVLNGYDFEGLICG